MIFNYMGKQHCTEQTLQCPEGHSPSCARKLPTYTGFPAGIRIQHEHWLDGIADINLHS